MLLQFFSNTSLFYEEMFNKDVKTYFVTFICWAKRRYVNTSISSAAKQGRARAVRTRNYRRARPRADICAPLPQRANYLVILILFGVTTLAVGRRYFLDYLVSCLCQKYLHFVKIFYDMPCVK